MENWIPFADAQYMVERAFLLAENQSAVDLFDTVVEVKSTAAGQRRLMGCGRIQNILMVTLLEDSDELDLVLDFGGEYKFRLTAPKVQGGKVFAANVKSMLQFYPTTPWVQLPIEEYHQLIDRARFLEKG
jgi:hypothetical protein